MNAHARLTTASKSSMPTANAETMEIIWMIWTTVDLLSGGQRMNIRMSTDSITTKIPMPIRISINQGPLSPASGQNSIFGVPPSVFM